MNCAEGLRLQNQVMEEEEEEEEGEEREEEEEEEGLMHVENHGYAGEGGGECGGRRSWRGNKALSEELG